MKLPLILAVAMSTAACASNRAVVIRIENHSAETIDDVAVKFNGGEKSGDGVEPGSVATIPIRPAGESNVRLVFRHNGQARTKLADVYLEPGYCGEVIFIVDASGSVTVVDKSVALSPTFNSDLDCPNRKR